MREYHIQISLVVDARDEEEAAEIAGCVRRAAETGTPYLVREVEIATVEEQ